MQKLDINHIKDFIRNTSEETKIYIGCDSERFRVGNVWHADYILVVVIHYDGKHGCKIFGQVERERDYDQRKDRPAMRLMTEVYKASELFLKLADAIGDRHHEVHLDLNPDEKHGSSCVVQQAVGYVKGVCNVTPMVKPSAWAASYAADRYKDAVVPYMEARG